MTFETFLIAVSCLSCLVWAYLLLFNGLFWLADQKLTAKELDELTAWPGVVAIIPARDEAETISQAMESHLQNNYPGSFSLIVVDDQSEDGTGDLIDQTMAANGRRCHKVEGTPLPDGWSGKLWALQNGLNAADRVAPEAEFILFTDADIVHGKDTLKRLVMWAKQEDHALVSIMAMLDARGFWGKLLIPAFVFFFQKLYPFRRVNDPRSQLAGAAGGCVLVSRSALRESGGIEAISRTLIDDCTLADRIKNHGLQSPDNMRRSIWLGFDRSVVSLRDNRALSTIWKMVARTAFTQLKFSRLMLVVSVLGLCVTYLAAPLTFLLLPLHGSGTAFSIATWALMGMIVAYLPTLLLYRLSPAWSLLLPLSAFMYLLMTISSALAHWRGAGGAWKGRTYGRS